jgi:hypothetical protein
MRRSPTRLRATAYRLRAAAERESNPEIRTVTETIADAYEQIAAKREGSGGQNLQ